MLSNRLSFARKLAASVTIFVVVLFATNGSYAQSISYTFTYFTVETDYADLTNDTVVSDLAWGSGGFSGMGYPDWTIPLGFDFQFFEQTTNKMFVMNNATVLSGLPEHDSIGIEFNSLPHNTLSPLCMPTFDRAWDPYMHHVPGLLYDATHPGFAPLSPISYKTIGVAPHRVTKIQYKNVGFLTDTSHLSFINFQVWLYEDSNIIEFRYGHQFIHPSIFQMVPFNDSGYIQGCTVWLNNDRTLGSCSETGRTFLVNGPHADPYLEYHDGPYAKPISPWPYLQGVPHNRLVYRFAPYIDTTGAHTDTITTLVTGTNREPAQFRVTPNPASDIISLEHKGIIDGTVSLIDMTGKTIWKKDLAATGHVNIEGLPSGIYLLRLVSADHKVYTTRFSKK